MKKLLIGLALLSSMSSFSSDIKESEIADGFIRTVTENQNINKAFFTFIRDNEKSKLLWNDERGRAFSYNPNIDQTVICHEEYSQENGFKYGCEINTAKHSLKF